MRKELNAFGRFKKEMDRLEKEELKELAKGEDEIIGTLVNRPQRQEISISPGTMVLGRLLFGKFNK